MVGRCSATSMNWRPKGFIKAFSLLWIFPATSHSVETAFETQRIFEIEGRGSTFVSAPVVSAAGTVAFFLREGGDVSIRVFGNGSVTEALRTSPSLPTIFFGDEFLALNSSGLVFFAGQTQEDLGNNCGRFFNLKIPGSSPKPITEPCDVGRSLSLSENGTGYYSRELSDRNELISNVSGSETLLRSTPGEYWIRPVSNDLGQVAATDYFEDRMILLEPDGSIIEVAGLFNGYCSPYPTSLNNRGELIFFAADCGPPSGPLSGTMYYYFRGEISELLRFPDSGLEIALLFEGFLNDLGTIIFSASLTDFRYGIFEYHQTGITPIFIDGDTFDGQRVEGVRLSLQPLDDDGNVAFSGVRTEQVGSTIREYHDIYRAKKASRATSSGGGALFLFSFPILGLLVWRACVRPVVGGASILARVSPQQCNECGVEHESSAD